ATGVTVNLSRFFINDDGSLFAESGRLRLLDDSGAVVAETTFQASNAAGKPHGSDFLVDWVEFDFPIVGVPLPPNEV
ncbi:MAG: hypothetical protein RLZZ220_2683, partial [Pseudomonadota bacterium]